ncbi:MAG TPA: zf-HC2 domain-containing protein [Nannocystaceae bacterium]|nr:zf-HC2 domain-containing protein [Nannocystaceae bacterium]
MAALLSFCLDDETLAAYARDELGPERRARAQRHLHDCAGCFVGLIGELRRIRDAGKTVKPPTPRAAAMPRPRRRWTTLLGLPLAGFVTTLAILGSVGDANEASLCDDPRAHAERAWSVEQRAALARDGAGAALASQLDREADAWARVTEERCAARDPIAAAELQCLAEQRERIAAFADTVLQHRAGDPRPRLRAAQWLGDPAWCAGIDVVPAEGSDPAELRLGLARLQGVALAGDREGAIAGLGELERRARELGQRSFEAELLLARGRIEAQGEQLDLAGASLLAAANTAEAARADAVVAEALLALVDVTAKGGELSRAREYADRTAAAIERTGVPNRRLDGRLALARAAIDLRAGDDARAESGLQAAATLLPPDDPARIDALTQLAEVQARRGFPRGAITTMQRVIEAQTDRLGEHHPLVALAHLDSARHHRALGERDAALLELDRGLPIALRSLGARSEPVGRMLDLRGELLRELGRRDEAIEHFRRARRILAELLGDHHESVEATVAHEALALAQ